MKRENTAQYQICNKDDADYELGDKKRPHHRVVCSAESIRSQSNVQATKRSRQTNITFAIERGTHSFASQS